MPFLGKWNTIKAVVKIVVEMAAKPILTLGNLNLPK